MSRILKKQDIVEILYGATLLGGGGGGSLKFGLEMLKKLENEGKDIQIQLIDVDEMNEDAYGTMVAGLGSPVAMLEGTFGLDAVYAFEAFKKALKGEGKNVEYLYSGEMGGFNTFVPMLVSILSCENLEGRIKFVDVDGNGRAVPEINTCLCSLRGCPPYPLGMGNATGDMIVAYPTDDKAGEVIARQLCMAYGMQIGFATWGLNREDMKNKASVGCVSYAQKIGKIIMECAKNIDLDIIKQLETVMQVRVICKGKVEKIELKVENGFDFGITTVVGDDGKKYFIEFKNENVIARDSEGNVYLTAPEIMAMIDGKSYIPLTNADTVEGMEIIYLAAPVEPLWWKEDMKAYECWVDILKMIGYEGSLVRY